MNPWITYRTRFLVKAKQLNNNLAFTDHLGRQHSGVKGDYLVEWSDGVLRIAPRKIFEDVYVPMMEGDLSEDIFNQPKQPRRWRGLPHRVCLSEGSTTLTGRADDPRHSGQPGKKFPQPCREGVSGSSQNCM